MSRNKKLTILKKFNLIPSICTKLDKNQIFKYENDDLVKVIEEDQELKVSILEINELLALNKTKSGQIPFTGKKVQVGIIDDGINDTFSSISNVTKYGIGDNKFREWMDDNISHGTIMASIVGNQLKTPDYETIGIAPGVNLIDFDISNPQQEHFFSNILEIFDKMVKEWISDTKAGYIRV